MTIVQTHRDSTVDRFGARAVAEPRQRSGVAERLTQILDVFTTGPDCLLLDDITDATGLPRSTVFRLLGQMIELGWLERDSVGYRLGPRAVAMAARTGDRSDLRAAAAGMLNALHLKTGGVAHLTVLEFASVVYLDKVGGAALSTVPSRVGSRLPATSTVSGRALLAALSPERVDAVLALEPTGRRNLAEVHADLNRIRARRGVAANTADQCPGRIGAVAAPILGPRGAVGAISLGLPGSTRLDRVVPVVAFAARRVAEELFPDWAAARRGAQGR
jgi:DNA-binding IclR family transcriptional regulator